MSFKAPNHIFQNWNKDLYIATKKEVTHDEYNNEMTKQADAELLIYPYRYFEFIKHIGLNIDFEVFKPLTLLS